MLCIFICFIHSSEMKQHYCCFCSINYITAFDVLDTLLTDFDASVWSDICSGDAVNTFAYVDINISDDGLRKCQYIAALCFVCFDY